MLHSPPPLHGYKINFDGAIFEKENVAGLGVVIRNHEGLVMASLFEVKALVVGRAVEFALELGFDNIFLEDLWRLLDTSSMTFFFLASIFSCFIVAHVRQQCNQVAHSLARKAIVSSPMSAWMKDVSLDLLTIV
ncbi:hypothetical protein ACB092_02G124200 [Castanea dentata]